MPKVNTNPNASANDLAGMLPVLSLATIMKGSTEPVTASGIMKQTEAAKNVVIPMFGWRHLHLQRRGHPVAEVRVLVDGGDRDDRTGNRVSNVRAYDPTPLF